MFFLNIGMKKDSGREHHDIHYWWVGGCVCCVYLMMSLKGEYNGGVFR